MEVFIHSKNSLKKNVINYIILLIPLYIYGIYKNGIILYTKDLINIFSVFKLLYLLILGVLIYFIKNIIFKKKVHLDLEFLSLFIIPLFMPYNINYILYIIGLFISLCLTELISKKININNIALAKLIIILLMIIFANYSYLNPGEANNIYALNSFDLLWGRNIGGLGSTSIILGVIIMVILALTNIYKPLISISSIVIYLLFGLLDKSLLFNGSNILALMFVSTLSSASPIKKTHQVIYGIFIGILTGIFCSLNVTFEGVFISILVCNIAYELYYKFKLKKY